jgi:hypothetical protein
MFYEYFKINTLREISTYITYDVRVEYLVIKKQSQSPLSETILFSQQSVSNKEMTAQKGKEMFKTCVHVLLVITVESMCLIVICSNFFCNNS